MSSIVSKRQSDTRNPNALRMHRTMSWIALTCATAALFGVMTDPAQQSTPLSSGEARLPGTPVASGGMRSLVLPEHQRVVAKPPRQLSSRGHILIPAIKVDALLIPLGLNSDGTLEVPKEWAVAGWFSGGPFPGEPGPAVVVGHVDSTRGPAVFYRLRELRRGDVIVVWRKGGIRSRFRVVSLRRFAKSAFPTQEVYGSVVTPALRLITCGGAFDRSTGHYVDNLIVFASP